MLILQLAQPALRGFLLFGGAVWVISAPQVSAQPASTDFDFLWQTVQQRYAYFDPSVAARWQCAEEKLRIRFGAVQSPPARLAVLENALELLLDNHAHLNTHNEKSWRLRPSGADLRGDWNGISATIAAVRPRTPAARMGVRTGDEIISVNDVPIAQAIADRLPICMSDTSAIPAAQISANSTPSAAGVFANPPDRDPRKNAVPLAGGSSAIPAAQNWALNALLAGQHAATRKLTIKRADGTLRTLWLGAPAVDFKPSKVTTIKQDGRNIAVIAIRDLHDEKTVARVNAQLTRLRTADAIILDLRETADGGNTRVAEPMMGRFITDAAPYQIVVSRDGIAMPRVVKPIGDFTLTQPIAVIVGAWTASMGEGVAIGLNAMRNAPVVGAPMAGLRGAVETFMLPESGWKFSIPTARLLHINGTPREDFLPIAPGKTDYGSDAIFATAIVAMKLPTLKPITRPAAQK